MDAMEYTPGQKPEYPLPPDDRLPAVEEHGRAVTANPTAAAWYRQAQRAVDCRRATRALEHAVAADPAFGLAIADLSAIKGLSTRAPRSRQMNWERHHIEVVRVASAGDAIRAADLLREHLANVGCDPIAARIAAHLRHPMQIQSGPLPDCHPTSWSRSR
jgi:DNA-binding GntR family transcriptional regulator